jgi:hypothetical protein
VFVVSRDRRGTFTDLLEDVPVGGPFGVNERGFTGEGSALLSVDIQDADWRMGSVIGILGASV